MHSKILIIYEYKNLFEILDEIAEILNFKILYCNKKEYDQIKFDPKINYLTISQKKIDGINNPLILDNLPLKLEKILEIININFLKNKFANQSYIKIGKYNLDLNSRKIAEEVLGVFHDPAFHVAVPQPKPKLLVGEPTFI